MNRTVNVILLAAGRGERFGGQKQFVAWDGKTMLERTLENYLFAEKINVMVPSGVVYKNDSANVEVMKGGDTRFDSIKKGFTFKNGKVLIADAARPFTPDWMIDDIIEALDYYESAAPAIPAYETVYRVENYRVVCVEDRKNQYFAQTPIGYRAEVLKDIFHLAEVYGEEKGFALTYYIWKYGLGKIKLIPGDPDNYKITYKRDLRK